MGKERRVDLSDMGKIPPQALEIEEAILGAILLESHAFLRVSHYFNHQIFYTDHHQTIIDAIKKINEERGVIDMLTVCDKLRVLGKLEEVGGATYIAQLTSKVGSAAHLEFHCMVITDKFLLRELIRIGHEMAVKAYDEGDPSEIAEWAENQILDNFDIEGDGRSSFKDALRLTLQDISNKQQGIISSFLKTGDSEVDAKISFRERQICLIAGAEGCGKTKYVTYLSKGMLDNNEDLRIVWFSMEDSKEQIIRAFISMEATLTTKQLQSINYTLSTEEMEKVTEVVDNFTAYNIEFIDRVSSIRTITRKIRLFREKYKDSKIIVIIDNLGLITTEAYYKGIEKDDYLAGRLKEMSDTTNASVFLLHHITKESSKRFNLEEGYRPRKEYIKGSTRILDYVQQALMLNLPRKYKDLVAEEKNKSKVYNVKPRTGKFDKTRFLMEFWTINPEGDKYTKDVTDLQTETWRELAFCIEVNKMPDGSDMGVGYILKKYIEYSIHMDEKNRHRQTQYKEPKLSIYTFIKNKKYTEDYSPKPSSRSYYLYGDDMSKMQDINNLFIVESVKNRDGNDVEDESIIRYKANLDYNLFKPIISKKDDEKSSKESGDSDTLSQL